MDFVVVPGTHYSLLLRSFLDTEFTPVYSGSLLKVVMPNGAVVVIESDTPAPGTFIQAGNTAPVLHIARLGDRTAQGMSAREAFDNLWGEGPYAAH